MHVHTLHCSLPFVQSGDMSEACLHSLGGLWPTGWEVMQVKGQRSEVQEYNKVHTIR